MPETPRPRWKSYVYGVIGAEISAFSRYYDRVVQWKAQKGDAGQLLEAIDAPRKESSDAAEFPFDLSAERDQRTGILLNATFNYDYDIQHLLQSLKTKLARTSRVIAVLYNPYYGPLYRLARRFNLKEGDEPTTFVTYAALANIARLAGFEVVRSRTTVYLPFRLLGLGDFLNRTLPLVPLLRHLSLVTIAVLRPIIPERDAPSLTVVVPARNERGNIAGALSRMPRIGAQTEVIFVEGHSSDGTWEEIQRLSATPHQGLRVRALQQTGRGKNDAVRLGFQEATGDVVTILDADLSMPPELLRSFYDAYAAGLSDFVNGSRLVYPMEGEAMRPLNKLGNVFFAKALRFVLDIPITDSLCGTKLVARHDVERIRRWRSDFGDFDPFGDFELLFPAAVLALGTIDVPIRYRARTYGTTNINRFRDGWVLLRMTLIGLLRIRTGRSS
jgi:hypothetical protein